MYISLSGETVTDKDKTRLQLSVSPALREWLETEAELRGQPMASVATHFLVDRMRDELRKNPPKKAHDNTTD